MNVKIKGAKKFLSGKKNIDEAIVNNINNDYLKKNIKNKSKNILKKIKGLIKNG